MLKRLILVGILLAAAAGCGDSDPSDRADADTTPTAGPDYETQVNALCEDLIDQILPVTGDKPHPSPEEFLDFAEKIDPLVDEFDSKVDALPVSEDDRSADEAFDAYRASVDGADEALRVVARTGDVEAFNAAFATFLSDLSASPEKAALSAEGITCPAR